jgi:hypothetical protein
MMITPPKLSFFGLRPISREARHEFEQLSWGERLRTFIRRHRPIHDVYTSDRPYLPPNRLKGKGAMAWLEPLSIIQADGTQISNTTTETIICPDYSIPAFLMSPSRTIYIWGFGVNSNVVTTPGTLTVRVRWGGVGGTQLLSTAAQGLDTTARTNALWNMEAKIVCRSEGATGTFMSGGIWAQINVLSSTATNLLPALMGSAGTPLASGNAAVTVDTTTAKLLSVTAQFSVATSPTNLTCQQRIIIINN